MIICCPHCQTKYQVTFEAIGSAGRKVQCAHCHRAWQQSPMPADKPVQSETGADTLFDAIAEDALDEAIMAEAGAVAAEQIVAPAPRQANPLPRLPDAAEMRRRQLAFSRRQHAMTSRLPLARLRRGARIAGIVILAALLGGAYFARVSIVERYPDLAGLYEAVGLGVNVVGLDFTNLETLKTFSSGNDVLMVSAQIVGRNLVPIRVPPVVISLLDDEGQAVYEWSVMPRVSDLMVGERATFDTRLSLPPSEAVRVRLSFAGMGASPAGAGANQSKAASPTPSPAAPALAPTSAVD
ncbi:MAG: hypothetical protein ABS75_09830 [Pelagibacterium sp. SCN 63-23]|nr:MAG: hypothetical protein ABS75_09830 [Pelagibacterium sp. SCN 63-23]